MLESLKQQVVSILCRVQIQEPDAEAIDMQRQQAAAAQMTFNHDESNSLATDEAVTQDDNLPKVGRNDPCPCGSGKKYKQCHGKLA